MRPREQAQKADEAKASDLSLPFSLSFEFVLCSSMTETNPRKTGALHARRRRSSDAAQRLSRVQAEQRRPGLVLRTVPAVALVEAGRQRASAAQLGDESQSGAARLDAV